MHASTHVPVLMPGQFDGAAWASTDSCGKRFKKKYFCKACTRMLGLPRSRAYPKSEQIHTSDNVSEQMETDNSQVHAARALASMNHVHTLEFVEHTTCQPRMRHAYARYLSHARMQKKTHTHTHTHTEAYFDLPSGHNCLVDHVDDFVGIRAARNRRCASTCA
jgi:hypothetical protein